MRKQFAQQYGFNDSEMDALPQDASFRRYFRLHRNERHALLMDAPPEHENIAPFITIANHLLALGLNAPRIYAQDLENGFALIEDFGNDTFTRHLLNGEDETKLYKMAIDVLCHLHKHENATKIELPKYDTQRLLDEAVLFVDWFYLAHRGKKITSEARQAYLEAWQEIFDGVAPAPQSLVLRDYHVDNLMRIKRSNEDQCGLLDFQDAVIGPTAYDVVSLLEDARRDISSELVAEIKTRYFNNVSDIDNKIFEQWYSVLGAQRHCKVAGIFVRLCLRDGKNYYLKHIPRVIRLLNQHICKPELKTLFHWLNIFLSEWNDPLPKNKLDDSF